MDDVLVSMLINGKVGVLHYYDETTIKDLISNFDPDTRKVIKDRCLGRLKNEFPTYAFLLIMDDEEEREFGLKYLDEDFSILFNNYFFHQFLGSTKWSVEYVKNNLVGLILVNEDNIFSIVKYAIFNNDLDIINCLAYHSNMVVRAKFMVEMLDSYSFYFDNIYKNILECFYNDKGELMEQSYVSKIAALILSNKNDIKSFLKIKEFIFKKYSLNDLAYELSMIDIESDGVYAKYIINDIEKLFITSRNYKWCLYLKYSNLINYDKLWIYDKLLRATALYDYDMIDIIFNRGLGDILINILEQYINKDTQVILVGSGTCSLVFKLNEYVLKISNRKWSYEDVICPHSYLFAKNYEEYYTRNRLGYITGAIEVQKYLSREVLKTQENLIEKYKEALKQSGLYVKDYLVDGMTGTNLFYLDDYHDADYEDESEIPEWFKKDPIVLVDRDLVFSLTNKNPKIVGRKI